MEQRLSIITLAVHDLQQSRIFYEKLGWQIATEQQSENIVAFNLQSFVLALYPKTDFMKELGLDTMPTSPPSFTLAYNVASNEEVDKIINEARAIGANIIKEPQHVFWGGYSGYFTDIDGYYWEIAHNPFAVLDDDGGFRWC